jgi:hypothetical protein
MFDKPLVARDIHDPDPASAGEIEEGKTQLNGNTALLFFL